MKKSIILMALTAVSSVSFAYGSFQYSYLEGSSKVCVYSDGSGVVVGMSAMCPTSN